MTEAAFDLQRAVIHLDLDYMLPKIRTFYFTRLDRKSVYMDGFHLEWNIFPYRVKIFLLVFQISHDDTSWKKIVTYLQNRCINNIYDRYLISLVVARSFSPFSNLSIVFGHICVTFWQCNSFLSFDTLFQKEKRVGSNVNPQKSVSVKVLQCAKSERALFCFLFKCLPQYWMAAL